MRRGGFACKGCSGCSGGDAPRFMPPAMPLLQDETAAAGQAHRALPALPKPVVALLGNPNTGKSSLFNALTGLRQHTGNWPGKTVAAARGLYRFQGQEYTVVDLPGTYSLDPASPEEGEAVEFILGRQGFGPDVLVVVVDATCLERSLALALEALSLDASCRVIICLNLVDEARRKGLVIDPHALSRELGVPVVETVARRGQGVDALRRAVAAAVVTAETAGGKPGGMAPLEPPVKPSLKSGNMAAPFLPGIAVMRERVTHQRAEAIASRVVRRLDESKGACKNGGRRSWEEWLDDTLTSPWTGYPVMILLLGFIFWLTITGANYPSHFLSRLFGLMERGLSALFAFVGLPEPIRAFLLQGVLRTTAWVVSVMLPPMAIFFPLFALLEDMGFLPRVAFNLDRFFRAAGASGKQALTMAMGFGCNAAGVTAARIIESPRERMIAILTNAFVPCNGRYPALIALSVLFIGGAFGAGAAAWLAGLVILGVACSLAVSWLLSRTLLRGLPSFFAMEIPPLRPPQVGRVILRSALDRTVHILWRAVTVAAPAGGVVWLLANTGTGDASLLARFASFLEPLGRLMGLDGHILGAFILGLPANEIVLPLAVMSYTQGRELAELGGLDSLGMALAAHGWTWLTAVCFMFFSLLHYPCATTLYTIWKECGRVRWAVLAAVIPLLVAASVTLAVAQVARLVAGA